MRSELETIVQSFRAHAGVRAKAALHLVTDVMGPTDWLSGPGDDAAVIPLGDTSLLLAAEAILPSFLEQDPFRAGIAAVVTNVNDVVAMGGSPMGLVDTLVGPERVARSALEGMRFAAELYGVPVVGGHLTITSGAPALSASILGQARALLSARNVAPSQAILLACCLEGRAHKDFPFFSSVHERGTKVRRDIELLPAAAEKGLCSAAKDVSMAGILGSLAMLLEASGHGATVQLDTIPHPDDVSLTWWLGAFPSFAFLLVTDEERVEACQELFQRHDLACERVGAVEHGAELRVALGDESAMLLDLKREDVTGLAS